MAHGRRAFRDERCKETASAGPYNELFTMDGAILPLLSATPLPAGFASAITPLQTGAPDVAFPRLNLLSYCLFVPRGADRADQLPDPRPCPAVRPRPLPGPGP